MRPVRIVMEGFSAFRDETTVEFADAELFAFVGPTGSGKSSVIDAMIFALYGVVPRYGSATLVHPVITQGKQEARVRLDFELGVEQYSVVRVVKRTARGASTREARLEHGDEVLAADARGVTAACESLLGLDVGQFTKCVVLPQGAFAELLHDGSAQRQDLLIKLLDLGIYERVASAARERVSGARSRHDVLAGQCEQVAGATPEAVAGVASRLSSARAALVVIETVTPKLVALDQQIEAAATSRRDLERQVAALGSIARPAAVDGVLGSVAVAVENLGAAEIAEQAARTAVAAAEEARAALGDPGAVDAAIRAIELADEFTERVDTGRALVDDAHRAVAPAATAAATARAALATAEAEHERLRVLDAAADLGRHLHVGDECPVCGNDVVTLPTADTAALAAAADAIAHHRQRVEEATRAETAATTELAALRAKLEEREGQLVAARAAVPADVTVADLRARRQAIEVAEAAALAARREEAAARDAVAAARRAHAAADAAVGDARTSYQRVRDGVVEQGPPAGTGDLGVDWQALLEWRDDRRTELEAVAASAAGETTALADERERLRAEAAAATRTAGIESRQGEALRDTCVRAVADLEAAHRRLTDDAERLATLTTEMAEVAADREVHDLVVATLRPKAFEAWLLDEALDALVAGASERLEQLSSGRFAIAVDSGQAFEVIDHANADERRLARTLSGGETFLASLALALALAERVAELAPGSDARLDAIFLDEGFGTLDPDTLDVVATAIEELGASGRMVGVVSHVRELAERVPTRFEVRSGPRTSTVERVDT